jgi:hypothetical protein
LHSRILSFEGAPPSVFALSLIRIALTVRMFIVICTVVHSQVFMYLSTGNWLLFLYPIFIHLIEHLFHHTFFNVRNLYTEAYGPEFV